MVNIPPNPLKRVVKSRRRRENFGDFGPDTWLFPPLVGGDSLIRGNNLGIRESGSEVQMGISSKSRT